MDSTVKFFSSTSGKITLAAAASSVATASIIFGIQKANRQEKRRKLRDQVEDSVKNDKDDYLLSSKKQNKQQQRQKEPVYDSEDEYDESLIQEQLARNIAFLGQDGTRKVRDAFVIVVGLGGVGSALATLLVRSGIGRIRLIDFDQVTLSSLNRHATATLSDVGTPKVIAAKNHYAKIAPWVKVDAQVELFKREEADTLLDGNPTWVIDCIDNISTKVDLLEYCYNKNIQVFSAMGAASKFDPSRIQICDISNTVEDPLARAVRRDLRLRGIVQGIPVVYSTQVPDPSIGLIPLDEEEFKNGPVSDLSALDSFRVRILPVLGPLPGMFGQAAAAWILCNISGFKIAPLAVKNRKKLYAKIYADLVRTEQMIFKEPRLIISEEDIGYIFEEVHRGKSVVAPNHVVGAKPRLLRWSPFESISIPGNLVCMDRPEAKKHEEQVLIPRKDPESVWDEETIKTVRWRADEDKYIRKWR